MAEHYQHISRKGKPGGYAALDEDGKVPAAQLPEGGGGGEANTASNVGTAGVGVFKQKTGVDLELKKLNPGSARLTITNNTGESRIDLDVPSGAFETAGAVAAHEAAGDPHAQYTTAAEAAAAAAAAVVTHEAASDPHAQYQRESEKDAANGYAGLSAGSKLAGTQQTYGAAANTAAEGNDARLSDARTPTAHAASHQNVGGDELNVAGLNGVLADPQPPIIGAGGTQAVAGNDARLADARAPTVHATSHQNGGSDEISVAGLNGVLADPQPPIIGSGATQAVAGNDARLTDARAPTAHVTSHQNGGSDEINVGGLNGVLADPQPPIIGAAGTQAVAGNDARLTDARTPTAHKTSHQDGGADEISVTGLSGLLADPQTPATHSHPLSEITGDGALAALNTVGTTQIDDDAVTLAKLAEIATARFLGRITAATGNPEALTGTQATTLLDVFTSLLKGLVPASGGGTSTFLRADGLFATPVAAASVIFTEFTKDLGVADRGGSFDVTGLSGLTADKPVFVMQTAAPIASKGNARDELELDPISVTGYVLNATTLRCHWNAQSAVVGTYAFAYLIGG